MSTEFEATTQTLLTQIVQTISESAEESRQQNAQIRQTISQFAEESRQHNAQLRQTISNFVEESRQQQRRLEESLETTSDQVGRLTEGLTEMRVAIREQSEIAKQQAENITRLVSVVDRQAVMVERLMDK